MAYRGLHIIPHDTRIDFMRQHTVTFAISVILIVGSILLIAFKGLNFGVDFAGGIRMEVEAKSGVADLTDMRAKLGEGGLGEVSLQRFGDPEDALIRLQHQDATPEDVAKATATLKAKKDPAIPADEIERRAPAEASALAQQRAIAKVRISWAMPTQSEARSSSAPKSARSISRTPFWLRSWRCLASWPMSGSAMSGSSP
jgi:preprotein translocase subunit SecF